MKLRGIRESVIRNSLGLQESSGDLSRKGFVVIQIDGLPFYMLEKAMEQGYAPFIKKLVQEKEYKLQRFRCGLPSTTTSFQLGVMYGEDNLAPGFRWLDKDGENIITTSNFANVQRIESDISSRGKRGILEKGSSYVNIFSGGAKRSLFTLSKTVDSLVPIMARMRDIAVLFLVNVGIGWRLILFSFLESIRDILDRFRSSLTGKPRCAGGLFFPIIRVITNVILKEIGTVATVTDIGRGVPSIFTTYMSYDEMAHNRGPESKAAFKEIKAIDRRVKRIHKAIERKKPGKYDLFILSDHGQIPTVPFETYFGESMREFLVKSSAIGVETHPLSPEKEAELSKLLSFIDQVRHLESLLPKPLRPFCDRFIRRLRERAPDGWPKLNWKNAEQIFVVPTGGMAHVYFGFKRGKVYYGEIEEKYPGLLRAIAGHPGIRCVVTKLESGILVMSSRGDIKVDGRIKVKGENPLGDLPEFRKTLREIRDLMAIGKSGDIIVFGGRNNGFLFSFERDLCGHGGIEPEEQDSFVISFPGVRFPFGGIKRKRDLYNLFSSYSRSPFLKDIKPEISKAVP